MCGISRSTHPAVLKYIPFLILELFPFFHQIFKILILFVLYFKNYKRQMVSWNCKHFQHVKIYLPCNFEVNLITHLGVIALFSSIFLAHLTQRVKWAIVTTERPSVNSSHFNQFLWSHWANLNQTLLKWSLGGPLPKLCPAFQTSDQDGHYSRT